MGSIVGVGVAVLGTSGVTWGWDGLGGILASWVIAPFISGVCAACIFLLTKYAVLKRKDSLRAGMMMMPVYFAFTTGILTVTFPFPYRVDLLDDGGLERSTIFEP